MPPSAGQPHAEQLLVGSGQLEEEAERVYKALETEVGEPDLSFFRHGEAVVLEVGELQVEYETDRLQYVLEGEALDLEPAVRIGCENTNWYNYSYARNQFEEAENPRSDYAYYREYETDKQDSEAEELNGCRSFPAPVRVILGSKSY